MNMNKPSTRDLLHFFGHEDEDEETEVSEAPECCPYCGEPDAGFHSIERCKKTFEADCEVDLLAETRQLLSEQLARDVEDDLRRMIEADYEADYDCDWPGDMGEI
jgi:hypothetical protein